MAEWKALQSKDSSKPAFKVRKANEGSDTKQWKGTVALEKKKKGDHSDSEEEEYEYDEVSEETLHKLFTQKIILSKSSSQTFLCVGRASIETVDVFMVNVDGKHIFKFLLT